MPTTVTFLEVFLAKSERMIAPMSEYSCEMMMDVYSAASFSSTFSCSSACLLSVSRRATQEKQKTMAKQTMAAYRCVCLSSL